MKEVEAGPVTKTMNVSIEEGAINVDALSKTITIPKLKNIVNVTVNTGTITYNVNGEQVTLNAKSGAPSRQVWNATKYSKAVSDTRQTEPGVDPSNLPVTVDYNNDGYIGTLNKSGNAALISGNPSHEKEVFDYRVHLGKACMSHGVDADLWPICEYPDATIPNEYYYDDGIKYGKLYLSGNERYSESYGHVHYSANRKNNSGEAGVYYPTYGLSADYNGTLTYRDTRVWEQNYSGTVYKGEYENYYSYTVKIEYIDNSNPGISLAQPTPNSPLQGRQAHEKGAA